MFITEGDRWAGLGHRQPLEREQSYTRLSKEDGHDTDSQRDRVNMFDRATGAQAID